MILEEKKFRLAEILAEARTLITDVGVESVNPYADITPPTPVGTMGTARQSPAVAQAFASLAVASTEVNAFELAVDLLDFAVDKIGIPLIGA